MYREGLYGYETIEVRREGRMGLGEEERCV